MSRTYRVLTVTFIHALFALTTAGIILALHKHEPAIALACAAAKSCLHAIWRSETLLMFLEQCKEEEKQE